MNRTVTVRIILTHLRITITFLDCVINHISHRFEQRGMIMYANMKSLVKTALDRHDFSALLNEVANFYDDFQKSRLETQLKMLPDIMPWITLSYRCCTSVSTEGERSALIV